MHQVEQVVERTRNEAFQLRIGKRVLVLSETNKQTSILSCLRRSSKIGLTFYFSLRLIFFPDACRLSDKIFISRGSILLDIESVPSPVEEGGKASNTDNVQVRTDSKPLPPFLSFSSYSLTRFSSHLVLILCTSTIFTTVLLKELANT